jgi:hypothetical protein
MSSFRIVAIAAVAALQGATKEDFETPDASGLPAGWCVAQSIEPPGGPSTNRATVGPATWACVADEGAFRGKRVLKLAESRARGGIYQIALAPHKPFGDGRVSVALRADGGREDRGGGVVWRAQDEANHYVARWNPLEKNLRAYRTVKGRRVMIADARVEGASGTWHTLAVITSGRGFEIWFDGEKRITGADDTWKEAGAVGLWTKGDATTSFDAFEAAPVAAAERK